MPYTVTVALMFLLAGAASAAAAPAPSPSGIAGPHPRVEILVGGRVLPQYHALNARYVEAVKNRDYEIRLTNPWPVRVAVALSVDGLNSIDARHTTVKAARKWVLDPYETVAISGWQVSLAEARRFRFTSEPRSYAAWLGKTANTGVISAVFFRERIVTPVPIVAEAPRGQAPTAPLPEASSARQRSEARGAGVGAAAAPAADEYAATGIGERTAHPVTQVSLELEDAPAASIDIRYEYRAQLVKLGVLPPTPDEDVLARRQRAQGFARGFCPDPRQPD